MKKLMLMAAGALAAVAALSSAPSPAGADNQAYYCDLTGYGYQSPDGDSYQFCMNNCVVDTPQGPMYGECWTVPPPPPNPPGNPPTDPGGPRNET